MTKHDSALSGVRGSYDRWSAVYDHDGNPLLALEEPYVRSAIGDVQGLRVLELGCGTGRHSLWMAAAGATVTALDFSDGMLAAARRKPGADDIRFVCQDVNEPLAFPSQHFDLVVSCLVLEHVRDLRAFFNEARRVVRPGGRAVVSAMHPAMFLRGSQARFTDPESGEVVQPGSINHTVADVVMATLHAGFAIDEIMEDAPDTALARRYPRALKYVDWPMLLAMQLRVT